MNTLDDESRTPAQTINAMKARQNFGEMLAQVYYKGDRFVIERAGRPMAALVPLGLLEEWQKQHGRPKTGSDTIKKHKRRRKQDEV
jgi:prevent-host-death family protein